MSLSLRLSVLILGLSSLLGSSLACKSASFPKIVTGNENNGITVVKTIDIMLEDTKQSRVFAGGYTNELSQSGSISPLMLPWVASFEIDR